MLTCKKCLNAKNEFVESSLEVTEGCAVVNANGVLKCREDGLSDENAKKPAGKDEL